MFKVKMVCCLLSLHLLTSVLLHARDCKIYKFIPSSLKFLLRILMYVNMLALFTLSDILGDDVESEDDIDDDLPLIMAGIVAELSQRQAGTRVSNYYKETIWRYNDVTFKSHFRLSREALKPCCSCLGNWKNFQHEVTVRGEIQCQFPNNFQFFYGTLLTQKP